MTKAKSIVDIIGITCFIFIFPKINTAYISNHLVDAYFPQMIFFAEFKFYFLVSTFSIADVLKLQVFAGQCIGPRRKAMSKPCSD